MSFNDKKIVTLVQTIFSSNLSFFFFFFLFHFFHYNLHSLLLSGNKRDRIETSTQCAEWSLNFGNLAYFTRILDNQKFLATVNNTLQQQRFHYRPSLFIDLFAAIHGWVPTCKYCAEKKAPVYRPHDQGPEYAYTHIFQGLNGRRSRGKPRRR